MIECDAHRMVQALQQHRRLTVHTLQQDASALARPIQTSVAGDHDVGGLGLTLVQNDFGVSVANGNPVTRVGNSRIRDFGEIDVSTLADRDSRRLLKTTQEQTGRALFGLLENDACRLAGPIQVALIVDRDIGRLRLADVQHRDGARLEIQLCHPIGAAPNSWGRDEGEVDGLAAFNGNADGSVETSSDHREAVARMLCESDSGRREEQRHDEKHLQCSAYHGPSSLVWPDDAPLSRLSGGCRSCERRLVRVDV